MDKRILAVMILLFSSVRGTFVHAQAPQRKEDLVDQVKSSIDRGVQYLRQTQQNDGSWKTDLILLDYRGGETALGVLALLNCGVSTSDPAVKNGLRFLRGLESNKTYVRALQTMALAEAGSPFDAELIKNNIDWLLSARVLDKDGKLIGWTYGKGIANRSDNSNSQFALLGLWAARTYLSNLSESDLKGRLGNKVWEQIRDFYLGTQLTKNADNGSWNYSAIPNRVYDQHGSLTMTTAGICGLIISGMELNPSREKLPKDGKAINCGVYNENTAIRDALKWIGGPPFDRLHLGDLDLVSTRTYYIATSRMPGGCGEDVVWALATVAAMRANTTNHKRPFEACSLICESPFWSGVLLDWTVELALLRRQCMRSDTVLIRPPRHAQPHSSAASRWSAPHSDRRRSVPRYLPTQPRARTEYGRDYPLSHRETGVLPCSPARHEDSQSQHPEVWSDFPWCRQSSTPSAPRLPAVFRLDRFARKHILQRVAPQP